MLMCNILSTHTSPDDTCHHTEPSTYLTKAFIGALSVTPDPWPWSSGPRCLQMTWTRGLRARWQEASTRWPRPGAGPACAAWRTAPTWAPRRGTPTTAPTPTPWRGWPAACARTRRWWRSSSSDAGWASTRSAGRSAAGASRGSSWPSTPSPKVRGAEERDGARKGFYKRNSQLQKLTWTELLPLVVKTGLAIRKGPE